MKRHIITWMAVLATLLMAVSPAGAQSLWPAPPLPTPQPESEAVLLTGHTVQVTVEEQAATYEVTLTLTNEGRRDAEADLVMPLPGQAAITALSLWIDGRQVEAQLLSAEQALQTYTAIVRQRLDPALLEYAGQGALRVRVFPVPAHGSAQVQIAFTQVLTRDAGLVSLEYPFQTSLPNGPELQPALVAQIKASAGVGTVYSPTHELQVARTTAGATVRAAGDVGAKGQPLVIYYGLQQEGVAASVLSYREADEDGYFMLLLTPPVQTAPVAAVSRDVILVLDTSGSMRGEKLEQAQAAALYILRNLNQGDRFGLISFGSSVDAYTEQLLALEQVEEAVRYVRDLQAGGGTNIDGALAAALALTAEERPQVILFLTDGLPTVGEVAVETILQNLDERANENVQLFSFGVGYDVNTLLLDRVSLDHHGTVTYVRPGEDIEQRVASLYDKISLPALTDVSLQVAGVGAHDLYPSPLPDLFTGEQLIVVGRYREPGAMQIELSGTRAGKTTFQEIEGLSLAAEGGADHVPAVWAARKVGYLLTAIRLHGAGGAVAPDELVDEVIALATQYGIVTPYTSFLADELEDAPLINAPLLRGPASLDTAAMPQPLPTASAAQEKSQSATGEAAVEQSIAEQALRDSERPAASATTQTVANKTFVLTDGAWVDTLYRADMPTETVTLGSARYAELLTLHHKWGKWLALGLRVTIVDEGHAYCFTE